jgi:benzoyl-CoA 2,3-dioxygenase component A
LMKLPRSLIDVELAFSREANMPKQYVQEKLRARADDVAHLLSDDDTYVYICGHKRMERGVEEALADICSTHGMYWPSVHGVMLDQGRYHVETYY